MKVLSKAIRVAAAPCSWGVLEFESDRQGSSYPRVLDEMTAAGYVGTELGDWGFLPAEPGKLRKELRSRDLQLAGAFMPMAFAEPEALGSGVEHALKVSRLLAQVEPSALLILSDDNGKNSVRVKSAGRIKPGQGLTKDQWRIFADSLQSVALAVFEETWVRSVFHHHCAGFVETPKEIETLLNLTDPDLIGLCFDTGHFVYGGGDALGGLKKYANRIRHVHFKDCDPKISRKAGIKRWDYFQAVQNGLFCELGKGSIDFPKIAGELTALCYQGWIVVEQDVFAGLGSPAGSPVSKQGSPLESAKRNRKYMYKLGL